MDKKQENRRLRKAFSPVGWLVIVYDIVLIACAAGGAYLIGLLQQSFADMEDSLFAGFLQDDGWGYLVMMVLMVALIWVWKGKHFCLDTLWTRGRPMNAGIFFSLLSVFLMGQMGFRLLSLIQELILSQFGLSATKAIENASIDNPTLSLFLYGCLGAPIIEEIVFRGVILRMLEKYGKRFAILMSAFFFGLLHCNIVQTPFAFAVGLVLGYVALEYNIVWAMVLHMVNNLVMGDMIIRAFGDVIGAMIVGLLIIGFTVAGVVILILRRGDTRQYVRENKVDDHAVHCFFTSPGVIVGIVVLMADMILTFIGMQM